MRHPQAPIRLRRPEDHLAHSVAAGQACLDGRAARGSTNPRSYADVSRALERASTAIGPNDLWIAAHALAAVGIERVTLGAHLLSRSATHTQRACSGMAFRHRGSALARGPAPQPGSACQSAWCSPAMRITIDSAGRVVLPKALRAAVSIVPGGTVEVSVWDGRIEIEVPPADVRVERHGHVWVVPSSLPTIRRRHVRRPARPQRGVASESSSTKPTAAQTCLLSHSRQLSIMAGTVSWPTPGWSVTRSLDAAASP